MLPTERGRRGRCHEVLDDDAVFEHRDLGVAGAFVRRLGADLVTHDHRPLDGFAPGQELGLAQDGWTATAGVAAVAAALPFGLQPGRSADALDLAVVLVFVLAGSRRPLMYDGVGRIVRGGPVVVVVTRAGLAATTAATTTVRAVGAAVLIAALVVGVVTGILVATLGVGLCIAGVAVVGVVAALLATTTATSATAPAAAPASRPLALVLVGIGSAVVAVVLVLVVGVGVVVELHRLRRHEQRQVVGPLGFGGRLEDQPRLRLVVVRPGRTVRPQPHPRLGCWPVLRAHARPHPLRPWTAGCGACRRVRSKHREHACWWCPAHAPASGPSASLAGPHWAESLLLCLG